MGFFDRFRKGKLFYGKNMPVMVTEFRFMKKKYILEEFDLEFRQDVNDKNKPDSDTYGGILTLTISEAPDQWINLWMMNPHEKRDGEIRFLANESKITEGASLIITFQDAYCISYHKTLNPKGAGTLTTLIISPHKIKVGNEEFENNWKS
ncbi:type VI secretion system tube protein TssD [Dysgonomonas sp. ZJ709]|uniref:type VI secretion system tube protein TssD n=1 Tax=Dysgonomonas sp. ZJ709 TaxID=2709797 RepID=UPI0013EB61E0|nr:type VI secretion system tube protein TssD [Dysgonomonas sp. ZJ709]